MSIAHGPPHDPAQNIAPAFVRRQHAIRDQKTSGAQVIGDDAARGRDIDGFGQVRRAELAAFLANILDQIGKKIDLVVVVLALQDGRDALEPHAGIDRGFRQRHAITGSTLLVLHEHEVPDFNKPVAIGIRRSRRAAWNFVAMIEEDF